MLIIAYVFTEYCLKCHLKNFQDLNNRLTQTVWLYTELIEL